MKLTALTQRLHMVHVGPVNIFLIDDPSGLVLIDTGFTSHVPKVEAAVAALGKSMSDLKHILITHAHPDHGGGAAELKKRTGARVYSHPFDAPLIAGKEPLRKLSAGPGVVAFLIFNLFIKNSRERIPGVETDQLLNEGDVLPFGKGLRVIHVPGHCKGQVALLYSDEKTVLIAADTCGNMGGLNWSVAYEDREEGKRSLEKICGYDFDIAAFGHGKPILSGADAAFRKRWKN